MLVTELCVKENGQMETLCLSLISTGT